MIITEEQIQAQLMLSKNLREDGAEINYSFNENGGTINIEPTFLNQVGDFVSGIPDGVTGAIKAIPTGMSKFGNEVMDTLSNGAYTEKFVPFLNENFPVLEDIDSTINNILKPENKAQEIGAMIGEPIGQIVVPGAVFTKGGQALNLGSKFLTNVLGYGTAEAIGINPQDNGLLELGIGLMVKNDDLKLALMESLKANEDESVLLQKLQKAPQRFFEGGIVGEALGKAVESVGTLYRYAKNSNGLTNVLQKVGDKAQGELDLDGTSSTLSMNAVGEADKILKKGLAKFAPNNIMEDTKLVLNKRAEEMKLPTNKRVQPSGQNPLFDTSDEAYQKIEVEQKETPVPRKTEEQVYPLNNRAKAIIDKTDAIVEVLAKKIIPFKGKNIQYFYNTSPIIQKAVELGIPKETALEQFKKFATNYAVTSPRTRTDQNLRNATLIEAKQKLNVNIDELIGPGGKGVNELGYPMKINPGGIHKKLIEVSRAEGLNFDTNPKPSTFAENVTGNLEGVTVDTHAIRAVIDVMNELEPGSVPIEWIGGKNADMTKKYREMYKKDPKSLDVSIMVADTLKSQALNKVKKQTEYAVFSDLYKKVAEKAGVKPAEAQSLSWFANGDRTGLESDPKTIVELLEDRIDVTAQLTGMNKEEVFKKFMQGSIPLASAGGLSLLDTGAMMDEGGTDGAT